MPVGFRGVMPARIAFDDCFECFEGRFRGLKGELSWLSLQVLQNQPPCSKQKEPTSQLVLSGAQVRTLRRLQRQRESFPHSQASLISVQTCSRYEQFKCGARNGVRE